jgi:hypothetical protein
MAPARRQPTLFFRATAAAAVLHALRRRRFVMPAATRRFAAAALSLMSVALGHFSPPAMPYRRFDDDAAVIFSAAARPLRRC